MLGKARFRSELLALMKVTNLRYWNLSFTFSLAFFFLGWTSSKGQLQFHFSDIVGKGGPTGDRNTVFPGCHREEGSLPALVVPTFTHHSHCGLHLLCPGLTWGWITIVLPAFLSSCLHHFPLPILHSFLYLTGAHFSGKLYFRYYFSKFHPCHVP